MNRCPEKKISEKKNPPEGIEPPTSRASVRHQHHCAITDLKIFSPRIEGCRFRKKVKKATQGRDRSIRFSKPGGGSVGFPKKKKINKKNLKKKKKNKQCYHCFLSIDYVDHFLFSVLVKTLN